MYSVEVDGIIMCQMYHVGLCLNVSCSALKIAAPSVKELTQWEETTPRYLSLYLHSWLSNISSDPSFNSLHRLSMGHKSPDRDVSENETT